MKEIGVLEAKTHLSSLLAEVAAGGEVTITRHGKPLARLVPADAGRSRPGPEAAARIRAIRDEMERLYGVEENFDWKAAIEEGRA